MVAELPARDVEKLERIPGLTVTWDAPVKKSGSGLLGGVTSTLSGTTAPSSSQLWTHETGVSKLWGGPQAPALAIVDSGIDTSHASFAGGRVVARQAFGLARAARSTAVGTEFVASIAAGNAPGYAGAAPNAI